MSVEITFPRCSGDKDAVIRLADVAAGLYTSVAAKSVPGRALLQLQQAANDVWTSVVDHIDKRVSVLEEAARGMPARERRDYDDEACTLRDLRDSLLELKGSQEATVCGGCDGSGIRPDTNNGRGTEPPHGFVVVERCDSCGKYPDDLAAAQAYGTDAIWQGHCDSTLSCQAICRPPEPEQPRQEPAVSEASVSESQPTLNDAAAALADPLIAQGVLLALAKVPGTLLHDPRVLRELSRWQVRRSDKPDGQSRYLLLHHRFGLMVSGGDPEAVAQTLTEQLCRRFKLLSELSAV